MGVGGGVRRGCLRSVPFHDKWLPIEGGAVLSSLREQTGLIKEYNIQTTGLKTKLMGLMEEHMQYVTFCAW